MSQIYKTAIVLKIADNKEYYEKFADYIFENIEQEEQKISQIMIENNVSKMLFLNGDEEIRFLDFKTASNIVSVTDSEWIIKRNDFVSSDGYGNSPTILKTKTNIKQPVINKKVSSFFQKQEWEKFLLEAEKWIFYNSVLSPDFVFIKYYLALTYYFKMKNSSKAIEHLTVCLAYKPEMSELWCLWGDMLLDMKKYMDALKIYKNALYAGQKRDIYDEYPMWIKKYKEYPESMIDKINNIMNNMRMAEVKK